MELLESLTNELTVNGDLLDNVASSLRECEYNNQLLYNYMPAFQIWEMDLLIDFWEN